MKHSPKPQNKKIDVACIVLFLTSVMLFFFGAQYYVRQRVIAQAFGVICLCGAAFFIIKKLTVYTYTVYPKDPETGKSVSDLMPEELTLIISRRFGSSPDANRAKLDLEALTDVTDLPSAYFEKRKTLKALGKMSLYYYTVTFRPPESTLLIFENEGVDRIGIVLEPDRDLKGFFTEILRINKENKKEDDK